MKPLHILLFVSLVFQTTIFSQSTGSVEGTVYDKESGETVIGANVVLMSDPSFGTVTDVFGKYKLDLEPGTHRIVCSFTGMRDTFEIEIIAGKSVPHDFTLVSTIILDDVEVHSSRVADVKDEDIKSMVKIPTALIDNRGDRDISTTLNTVDASTTILDGEPQIRGGSGFTFGVGAKVSIIVDDIPMMSPDAGKPEWGFIPVENLADLEIIKGASSVLVPGSALSGAILMKTNQPGFNPSTKVSVYAGMYDRPRDKSMKWWNDFPYIAGVKFLHMRRLTPNLDFTIGGTFDADHSYLGAPRPDATVIDSITNFSDNQMQSQKARINFGLRHRPKKVKGMMYGLNGNFMYSNSNSVFAWQDDSLNFYRAYPGAMLLQQQFIFNIDPYLTFIEGVGNTHKVRMRYMYANNDMSNDMNALGMIAYGEYTFNRYYKNLDSLQLTIGLAGQYNYSASGMYADAGGDSVNHLLNASMYLEVQKQFWDIMNIVLGFRGEYFDPFGDKSKRKVAPLFRGGINFKLAQGTFLRASFGQGFRYPTITERNINIQLGILGVYPNQDLVPEYSWNAEIGIKQGFRYRKFQGFIDVAGFMQQYKNTIEYLFGFWKTQFPWVGFKFINTGRSRVYGVDASFIGDITFDKLQTTKNYSMNFMIGYTYSLPQTLEPDYVYAQDLNPSGDDELSFRSTSADSNTNVLKYRFIHTIKGDVEFKIKGFAIGASFRYFSKMENVDKSIFDFEDATAGSTSLQNLEYRDYFENQNNGNFVMDARISYSFKGGHRVSVMCNNLTNRWYSLRPLKAEQMRSWMISYTANLEHKNKIKKKEEPKMK